MGRIRFLLVKELTQLRRDRRLFGILLIAPVIQLLVLGYAATTDVRKITLAVRDNDHSWHSREYVRSLASSGYFEPFALTGPAQGDEASLVSGRAGLVLTIPRGFGEALMNGRRAAVQALVDGADSNFAVHGVNYLQRASRLFSVRLAATARGELARMRGEVVPTVVAETRSWYNPELSSQHFMVPAVMGALLLVTTMLVTSMALTKEREDGTMEQLVVTPLRPHELIVGKLLPFVVVGFLELTLALVVMLVIFRIPMRGNIFLLYLLSGLFLLTTLGLGLFISTLVKTQQQAMMVSAFFVMMPFMLLSGFIFPVENMPPVIRAFASVIPLKYYLTIVRGIFLKGTGMVALWREALFLLVWGGAILGLAAAKFRKRLD